MTAVLPPVPHKAKIIGENGYLTEPWSKFFHQLFGRVGGPIAPTNRELASTSESNAALASDIAALQLLTTSMNNKIKLLEGGIGKGPEL